MYFVLFLSIVPEVIEYINNQECDPLLYSAKPIIFIYLREKPNMYNIFKKNPPLWSHFDQITYKTNESVDTQNI